MTEMVRLRRPRAPFAVPLAPLVDVLLILLIFFMVTSTYRDLDMIPLAETAAEPPPAVAAVGDSDTLPAAAVPVLVRLDAAGRAAIGGAPLDGAGVAAEIARRLSERPDAAVIILPSPRASTQSLVRLLEAVASGGAARLSILRVEEAPVP